MGVEKGDFVLLDYTGTTNGRVFDTTIESVAKKNNVYIPQRMYKPMVVAAGKGDLIKGIDTAIIGMEKGEEKKLEIQPVDGYGERNPQLIKIVPLKVFTDNKMKPYPGMPVRLDNMTARVQSVSGGRVRVDFNHELAGKILNFDIKIVDIITKDNDKVQVLAEQFFNKDDIKIEYKEKKIIVTPKKDILTSKGYAQAKAYFITQVNNYFPDKTVEFVEEYPGKA